MRARLSKILTLSLILCATLPVLAEDSTKEKEDRSWTNKTTLGLVNTTGNSETTNFAVSNLFTRKWKRSNLEVTASALRSETTTRILSNQGGTAIETSATSTSAERYTLGTKYNSTIQNGLEWYAAAGWYRDRFAGIQNSYQGGGGLAYLFFENDRHKLQSEAGFAYVQEDRVDGTESTFPDLRAFLGYERALSESSKLTAHLEVLENLDETSDLRANALIGVTANLNKRVALNVGYEIKYDAEPVMVVVPGDPAAIPPVPDALFEFDEIDTTLKAALVINF